jgi:asparagine synthase (glutamine-hydrolysing)
LCKIDRATMHVSLEGREPLLDHRLIEFMAQVPDEWKIRNGEKKYILKKILGNYIPLSLFDRPKMGFGLPIVNWFSKELKIYFDIYLNDDQILKQGLFNINVINFWKSQYFRGRLEYFEPLWAMLVFQMWYKKWIS